MTSTVFAARTGTPHPRRTFLRQLASLPLIGGGLTLVGKPTAVAEPVTFDLMENYKTWLLFERRCLAWEMAEHPEAEAWHAGRDRSERFHEV